MFYEDDEVIINLSKITMVKKETDGQLTITMIGGHWDYREQMGENIYWFTKSEAPRFLKKYREYMKGR